MKQFNPASVYYIEEQDIHRHVLSKQGLISHYDPDVDTLYDAFQKTVKEHGSRPCLGKLVNGVYEWMTYEEVGGKVANLSSALKMRYALQMGSLVGIMAKNKPEWIIAEQACYARSWVTVPLYDNSSRENILAIIEQTEMKLCFCDAVHARFLSEHIENVITLDRRLDGFLFINDLKAEEHVLDSPPKAADLFTICYTSGAMGQPKGAMLPHSAMIASLGAMMAVIGNNPTGVRYFCALDSQDAYLSYLPLAHIFERHILHLILVLGAGIGFSSGDILKLSDDAQALSPTGMIVVPRICNRIYERVNAGLSGSFIWRKIWQWGVWWKKRALYKKGKFRHWLIDRVLFGRIQKRLGSRVSMVMSGSAPLAPEVMEFMRLALGCPVYEGYGQTETCGGCTSNVDGDWRDSMGTVGFPLPCFDIKIESQEGSNGGEILVRGPACFTGYFKDDEKTRETIRDGWIYTGDIGEWDCDGRLRIVDRKKNIFKLAQGEYIAPERIEGILQRISGVSQVYLHGDSLQTCTLAILILTETGELNEVIREIEKLGAERTLSGLEMPRAVFVESDTWTVENGLLTPTLKPKRPAIKEKYQTLFSRMYEALKTKQSKVKKILVFEE